MRFAPRVICGLTAGLAVVSLGCGRRSGHAPQATAATPAYRNEAEAAGLGDFRHTAGGSGRKFFVEQMGSGVAILDVDADGLQDLYFCSGTALPGFKGKSPGNRLFRNRGGMKFEDVTGLAGVRCGQYSIGAAAGDYDNDGDLDLYLSCFGPNVLYRNNGDGTFTDVTSETGVGDPRLSAQAAWGDYNGDGYLDLYVANYVKYDLNKDLWCSSFAGQKSFCGPTAYPSDPDTLYRNNGDGTFTDVSVASGIRTKNGNGLGVLWFDANEDGKWDIFVANDQSPNFLWENQGNGKFIDTAVKTRVAFGEEGNVRAGMGVDLGDFDNDQALDLVVTNFSEENNAVYRNRRDHFQDVAFTAGVGTPTLLLLGFGTHYVDYDNDGWLDLFFANGHVMDDIEKYSDSITWAQPLQLFRNRRDGRFEEVSSLSGVGATRQVARGSAMGDLDNDGWADIVVNVLQAKPMLLHNIGSATGHHWIGLRLKARTGSPTAVGARVTLQGGGVTQTRVVRTSGSYASSNDLRPLFGLGLSGTVDLLRVKWPSGRLTELRRPPIDRYLDIEEPGDGG